MADTSKLLDELDVLMQRMLALPVQDEKDEAEVEVENTKKKEPQPKPNPAAKTITPRRGNKGEAEAEGESTKKKEPQPEPIPAVKTIAPRSVNLVPVYSPTMTVQAPAVTNTAPVVIAGKIPAFWPAPTDTKKSAPGIEAARPASAPMAPPPAAAPVLPILLQRPQAPAVKRTPLLPPAPPYSNTPPKIAAETRIPRTEPAPPPRPVWLQTPPATAPVPQPGSVKRWLLTINAPFDTCTAILGGLGRWLRGEQGRAIIGLSGLVMIAAAAIWALILFRG